MKQNTKALRASRRPSEDEIRDYAFHLYVQGGCVPGHDAEHWQEAESCLRANIPMEHTRTRLHRHMQRP